MSNSANVIFVDNNCKISPAIYTHWHGAPHEIMQFLEELRRRDVVGCGADYVAARFAHIICDYEDRDKATAHGVGIESGPDDITVRSIQKFVHGTGHGCYVVECEFGFWYTRRYVFENGRTRALTHNEVDDELVAAQKMNDLKISDVLRTLRPVVE